MPQLWLNGILALIGRYLLNFICHASASFPSGGVVFEYSMDEKDHPKSLALRGRVDALISAEFQKVLDRLMQAGERMILVDFAEVN